MIHKLMMKDMMTNIKENNENNNNNNKTNNNNNKNTNRYCSAIFRTWVASFFFRRVDRALLRHGLSRKYGFSKGYHIDRCYKEKCNSFVPQRNVVHVFYFSLLLIHTILHNLVFFL